MKRGAAWTIYHPNGKGTGSAVKMELHPAHGVVAGSMFVTLAPQKTIGERTAESIIAPMFDWNRAICLKMDIVELTQIIQVLRGCQESIEDGKGLFHRSTEASAVIKFEHRIEPVPGYMLDVCKRPTDGELTRVSFFFRPVEAATLGLALEGSMVELAFGINSSMDRDGE